MTGRRAVIGLSLLSALVFCAFAAPNAMALKGTTAFTCVHVLTGAQFANTDEHCAKPLGGLTEGFKHEEIAPNTKTKLIVSNTETGSKLSFPKFKSTIAGTEFELEAGGTRSSLNSFMENKEVEKQMVITGEGGSEFYNVVVNKPAKCTVKNILINEKSTGTSVVNATEMYGEVKAPAGGAFASFELEGAECALKGVKIEVKGSAKFNISKEEGHNDGATVNYTTAGTEGTLKVGAIAAKFEGTTTPRMQPEVGKEENPISATTTTN
jgi:hypothetical protein